MDGWLKGEEGKERGANSRVAQLCTQIKLKEIEYGLGFH